MPDIPPPAVPPPAVPPPAVPPPGDADLWWFDIRPIRPGPADLAELDDAERAKAASFAFPADRHRYQAALQTVLAGQAWSSQAARTVSRLIPAPEARASAAR